MLLMDELFCVGGIITVRFRQEEREFLGAQKNSWPTVWYNKVSILSWEFKRNQHTSVHRGLSHYNGDNAEMHMRSLI